MTTVGATNSFLAGNFKSGTVNLDKSPELGSHRPQGRPTTVMLNGEDSFVLFFFLRFCFYVYGFFGCKHMWVPHACLVSEIQKKASDPLELKLQTVVNCHVGARTPTVSSKGTVSALNC